MDKKKGLPSNYIYKLLYFEGKILGAGSGGIFEIGDFYGTPKVEKISFKGEIRDFIPYKKGYLIVMDEGLFYYERGNLKSLIKSKPPDGKNIIIERDGSFYYLSHNSIYKLEEDFNFKVFKNFDFTPTTFAFIQENLYLGSKEALYIFSEGKLKFKKKLSFVNTILCDKENFWIGTEDGLYFIQNEKEIKIGLKEGLPSNYIYSLFKDREGNLWIGTDSGLSKLQSMGFENYYEEEGLLSSSLWAFYELEDGKILFGGEKGIGIFDGKKVKEIPINNLKGDGVRSFASKGKKIFMAFKNLGIYTLYPKENFKIKRLIKDDIRGVFSIYIDLNENLWIATIDGVYKIGKDGKRYFNKDDGLPDDTVFKIIEDGEKNILALTDKGIAVYEKDKFNISEKYKVLNGTSTRSIVFEGEDKIYVGTLGDGLFYYNGKEWNNLNEERGFPSNFIWSMEKDSLGFLWVGTSKGIVMFAPGYSSLFNTHDGLVGDEVTLNGVLKTRDGKIWFGLVFGAIRIDPYKVEPNLNPPNLFFEKIETEERSLAIKDKIILKPSEKRISIFFNGLSFQDETEVSYIYRLLPQEDWSTPSFERKVTYSNLKPGKYSFEIKSRNASGIWNDLPIKIDLEKLPYVYERLSFKIFILGLFLFLFYFYFRFRTNQIKKSKERLERIVEDKTRELQERIKELYVTSTTDYLTKVFNRGYFEKLLKEEVQRAKREESIIGLAILDIDNFKDLNDALGHTHGDLVLTEFGKILKKSFRSTDIIARYGGDEFVILFLSTEPEGCISRLKKLMEEAKGFSKYNLGEKKIQISLSVGILFISFKEEKNKVLELEYIRRFADKALYEAKRRGKDSIVVYNFL